MPVDVKSGSQSVDEAILTRRSPRTFSGKAVASEDLKKVFEAARWAASSYNEQTWRFFMGRKGDATYKKIFDSLVPFNQEWAKSAPVLILSVGAVKFAHNATPNRYTLHDTGAATALLTLQAFALGLHTHSMGGFDMAAAREAFQVSDEYEMGAVTALGYLGDGSELSEQFQKMEKARRTRKPLGEIVLAAWDEPAAF